MQEQSHNTHSVAVTALNSVHLSPKWSTHNKISGPQEQSCRVSYSILW